MAATNKHRRKGKEKGGRANLESSALLWHRLHVTQLPHETHVQVDASADVGLQCSADGTHLNYMNIVHIQYKCADTCIHLKR